MANNLFQLGKFVLNSGATSTWKLECDALTTDDWLCLAEMVREVVGPFSGVEGVPSGGLKLADCLKPYCATGKDPYGSDWPHLIVDDVLTTGGSMERTAEAFRTSSLAENRGLPPYVGAVVFARGQCPSWVKPLLQLPPKLWLPKTGVA
jgi:orotate phosphoribosyltransferase